LASKGKALGSIFAASYLFDGMKHSGANLQYQALIPFSGFSF